MRYFEIICIVTAILSHDLSVTASPVATTDSLGTGEMVARDHAVSHGANALKKAYLKYGVKPPPSLVARAVQSGSVKATPADPYDSEYLIPVAIGSPATTYTMDLDTGSSDFSVYAPKLGTKGSVTTTVSIGGVTVTNQVVTLQGSSSTGSNNNIVGMAPGGKNWYTNAVAQGMPAILTASLKKGAAGTYGLGFIDPKAYQGSITYVTGDASQGFWGVSSNGYAIGAGKFVTSTIPGIIDTGTTLLLLPQSIVAAYYKQVSGAVYDASQGGYTFPCTATLPDFTLGFAAYKATVPGSYLNYAPLSQGSTTCYGGLQSSDGIGFNIFGDVFIKSQFIVLKGTGSLSIGFAKQA